MLQHLIFQAASSGETGAGLFWDTTPGKVIGALFGAAGVLVVLVTAVKGFTAVSQGKPGQAFKSIFGAVILCVFLFRPSTMNDVISTAADLFENILGDVKNIKDCTATSAQVCNDAAQTSVAAQG